MSLKIAIAGLRRGASFNAVFQQRPDCQVTAVCDPNEQRAREFAEAHSIPTWCTSYDDLLSEPADVIVVATPAPLHAGHCIAALGAHKHVISEVPAVQTLEEAAALVQAVQESGMKYMFAENVNYASFVQTFDTIVKAGRIGEPYYAECEYIHDCRSLMTARDDGITPGSDTGPTWRAAMRPILYCTHSLGPILQILDDRIVTAVGMTTGPRIGTPTNTADIEVGLYRTAKGSIVKMTVGFHVAREPAFHYFSIYGTEGVLETPRGGYQGYKAILNDIPNMEAMLDLPLSWSHPKPPPGAGAGGHGTCEFYMIDDFVRAIMDDAQPALDVYRGLDMTLPGVCALASADQGSIPIEVPDFRPGAA